MHEVDTTQNPRLPAIVTAVKDLSSATEPADVLRIFATRMLELGEVEGYVSLSTRGLGAGEYKITREMIDTSLDPAAMVREGLKPNPWKNWESMPTHTGGILGRVIATPEPKIYHDVDLRGDPVMGDRLAHYRSLMAVPLFDHGQVLNWAVQLDPGSDSFDLGMLEESIMRSNLAGNTTRQLLISSQLREANEKIRAEIELIANIQKSLLPRSLPDVPQMNLAASYETYDRAGGDFYDVATFADRALAGGRADDGRWGLLIADASGHGPAAATVMAMIAAIFRTYPKNPQGPAQVMEYLNQHLCATRIEATFVTSFLAFFDPSDMTLTYSCAGHPPPLIKSPGKNGQVHRLDQAGTFPLGVVEGTPFGQATFELKDRQTLLMYTDGITEATDRQGRFFGVDGIETALAQCVGDPTCTVETVHQALRHHEAGGRPTDDQTLLAVQVNSG